MTAPPVVAALQPRDVVLVSGADAAGYLQGQISQDVDALRADASAWSLVLAPQGKVDAWFRITRRSDECFLLDVDAGFGPALVARLERFKLRVDAAVEAVPDWRMLAVRGRCDDAAWLDAAGAEVRAEVSWPEFSGIDLLGPDVAVPPGLVVAPASQMEVLRIRAGWPAMGRELTERTIPAEVAGLLDASVSFTKGCYTGQELVARIDSRGASVPRPVRLLEINAVSGVAPGDEIVVDDKTVGTVTSVAVDTDAATTVALAPVHRRVAPPAAAQVAGRAATVLATPADASQRQTH